MKSQYTILDCLPFQDLEIGNDGFDTPVIKKSITFGGRSLVDESGKLRSYLELHFPTSLADVGEEHLIRISDLHAAGLISLDDIKKQFRCGVDTYNAALTKHNIPYPEVPSGRQKKLISSFDVADTIEYRQDFRVGYKRATDALNKRGKNVNSGQMRAIYETQDLYLYEKEYEDKDPHPYRFVADYANQLWHIDLHYYQKIGDEWVYLLGIIDDRTRYLIALQRLADRTALTVANALREILSKVPLPHTIVMDNGAEFIGDVFKKVLTDHGITPHYIKPHTPQENGKIERLWRTFNSSMINRDDLDTFIHEYNVVWNHSGLFAITNTHMAPATAWRTMPHWNPDLPANITYY
jgi:transposase InsO family protein